MAVEQATLGQNTFTVLEALIKDNLPTYSFDGTPFTYILVAPFPNKDVVFPSIELGDPKGDFITITMNAETGDVIIEIIINFYAKELHGKKAIAVGRDGLRNTFINNISTFIGTDKLIPEEDFWTDNPVSEIDIDNQVINTATSVIKFKLG